MSYLLISTVDLDLWTMVVISSSLLTSIQVVGHLVHYCLYLYDSFRSETLESIDDYVYYLKSIVHASELISALFVVCAGLKEAATGHWSLINSVVLLVHCYFNVWIRIKSGWRSFLLRQVSLTSLTLIILRMARARGDFLKTITNIIKTNKPRNFSSKVTKPQQ